MSEILALYIFSLGRARDTCVFSLSFPRVQKEENQI